MHLNPMVFRFTASGPSAESAFTRHAAEDRELPVDPFARRATVSQADLGRYALTHVEADRHVFRVPSLRNVEITAPYFHDGSTPTLEEAVDRMAKSQLGRTLTAEEIDLIAQFLRTLTGEAASRVPP